MPDNWARQQYFLTAVGMDLHDLICGEQLGRGIDRQVHVYRPDPSKVIKLEFGVGRFQNVAEWQLWSELAWETPKKGDPGWWLAPVHAISPCGSWLIQSRTTPPTTKDLPEKMPVWLTDYKRSNYGMFEGRLVCHDYGTNTALAHGTETSRMRKADWWDEEWRDG